MITKVFSLYDSKAKAFGPPAHISTVGLAIRGLQNAVEAREGDLGKHPEDFVLYEIAEWDDNTGEFINKNPHNLTCLAADFKINKIKPVEQTEIKAVI